jgi:hypothetical protein
MCEVCIAFLEEAALKSAANMGIPEQFGCSQCGLWFKTEHFMKHPCIKNAKS